MESAYRAYLYRKGSLRPVGLNCWLERRDSFAGKHANTCTWRNERQVATDKLSIQIGVNDEDVTACALNQLANFIKLLEDPPRLHSDRQGTRGS